MGLKDDFFTKTWKRNKERNKQNKGRRRKEEYRHTEAQKKNTDTHKPASTRSQASTQCGVLGFHHYQHRITGCHVGPGYSF